MFNVNDVIFTVDTFVDKEGNPVQHAVGAHRIAGVHADTNGVSYEFVAGNQIFKVSEKKVARCFDYMVYMVESSEGDMKVCRRCGAIFKAGDGFEMEGLKLCLKCAESVRSALSEKYSCDCECKECDCEKADSKEENTVEA